MTNPIKNGTTSEPYRPPSMGTARPGAQDHQRIASLLTGNVPLKQPAFYTAPPSNIPPREPKMTVAKKIPAKSTKPADKQKRVAEDYSTPYKPATLIVSALTPDPVAVPAPVMLGNKRKRTDTPAAPNYVDVASLEICNDSPVFKRFQSTSKYLDFFGQMRQGDCVKCQPEHVGQVSGALESYLRRKGVEAKVKTTIHYPTDNLGRVWWLDKKAA